MEFITKEELEKSIKLLESKADYVRLSNFDYMNNQGGILTEEQLNEQEWLDKVQTFLDWVGLVPYIGDIVDAINALIYFIRAGVDGKFMPNGLNGLLSCIAIIPVVGSAISLPLKMLFKSIPTGAATRVIKELYQGSGEKAARELVESATSAESKGLWGNLKRLLVKNADKIADGLKVWKDRIKSLDVIPFAKWDNTLVGKLGDLIGRIEDFFRTLIKNSDTAVKQGLKKSLKIQKIPTNLITKGGRISYTKSRTLLRRWFPLIGRLTSIRPGHTRMFYATQDMFVNYLKKEGKQVLTSESQDAIFKQTLKNLGGGPMKAGQSGLESIADYAKRTGIGEDRIYREFTNLTIVNEEKIFADFLGSAGAGTRAEMVLRTMDPSVAGDARSFWNTMRKAPLAGAKTLNKADEDDYRDKREMDSYQSDVDKSEESRTGSHYGKRRNY